MNVLFVTPECAPFVKTGGLGDVSAALPVALQALGHQVVVLMPAYSDLKVDGQLTGIVPVPADGPWPAAQLLHVHPAQGVPLLLLSCPALYGRAGTPYDCPDGTSASAQALRFAMLSRVAALIGTQRTPSGWQADVVHANDWPAALAPLYLHLARIQGAGPVAASLLTLHNLAFQGLFPLEVAAPLQIPPEHCTVDGVEYWGQLSMLKAGIQYADAVTTVSPTYAREIQTTPLGFGLEGVLARHAGKLHGVLNGVDTAVWNPATDPLIASRYDAQNLAGKTANRAALRARCDLADSSGPLLGLVGRLTAQKGVDLVIAGAPRFLAAGAQLVVLGQGEAAFESALQSLAARHPGQVHVARGFDENLAHLIEAAADCFLMPSRFEPCGLNQMYSQRYGTPPVVTATGGLADTVIDAGNGLDRGTGFVLQAPTQQEFDRALDRVLAAWAQPALWRGLQQRGMQKDWGWQTSAHRYASLYETLLVSRTTGKT